jgi:hypothetical protein
MPARPSLAAGARLPGFNLSRAWSRSRASVHKTVPTRIPDAKLILHPATGARSNCRCNPV